jgi:hypothetical protein
VLYILVDSQLAWLRWDVFLFVLSVLPLSDKSIAVSSSNSNDDNDDNNMQSIQKKAHLCLAESMSNEG